MKHSDYIPLVTFLKALKVTKTKEWDQYGLEAGYMRIMKDMERALFMGLGKDGLNDLNAGSAFIGLLETITTKEN